MNEKSIILYHGTDAKIPTPDLTKCKTFRDFGRAFYLSYNMGLAKDWATKKNSYAPTMTLSSVLSPTTPCKTGLIKSKQEIAPKLDSVKI